MPNVLLHGVPPQLHRALKARAALNGHSVEAEILSILDQTVRSRASVGIGSDFLALAQSFSGMSAPAKPAKPETPSE